MDAQRILAEAHKFIGVREEPWGSNDGRTVREFQSVTRAYRAPWCASFVQAVLKWSGYGTIADDSAGAYYIGSYGRRHGWQVWTTPRPADIVVYFIGAGHIGIVDQVLVNGDWYAIEGNENNSVTRKYRSRTTPHIFLRLPNVKPRPRVRWLPRFELVTSVNGHAKVLVGWGKWRKVGPRIPGLLSRYRTVQVRKKYVRVVS